MIETGKICCNLFFTEYVLYFKYKKTAGEKTKKYSTDFSTIEPDYTQYDEEANTMGIHGFNRGVSNGVLNVPKEFADKIIKPVTNPTNENLMEGLVTAEHKEWKEVEKRSCTIQKIYEYPIVGPGNERKLGHGFILKPDTLKDNESKDFTISHSVDEEDISQFKEGQKVWHITYTQERPATDEEKEYPGEGIETITDRKYVTKSMESEK